MDGGRGQEAGHDLGRQRGRHGVDGDGRVWHEECRVAGWDNGRVKRAPRRARRCWSRVRGRGGRDECWGGHQAEDGWAGAPNMQARSGYRVNKTKCANKWHRVAPFRAPVSLVAPGPRPSPPMRPSRPIAAGESRFRPLESTVMPEARAP